MKCPKCHNELEKVTFHHVEVDRCRECRGLWFDLLEHEELKLLKGSEAIDDGDPVIGRKYNKIDRIDCPSCRSKMIRMVDRDQPHIWYEFCGVCHGLFFDAGEFTDFKEKTIADYFKGLLSRERV